MINKYKELILLNIYRILTIRHFLKLHFFKSPMQLKLSLKFQLNKIKAKLLFINSKNNLNYAYKKEANNFNKKGYTTFSNTIIEKNCLLIKNKLKEIENPWDETNNFAYEAPSKTFKKELINIFKNGIDEFIKSAFKSDYYIFYHRLYKSERLIESQVPEGSELWHADGGPGSCMNLMICHTHLNKENGSMKIIPWERSKLLLSRLFFDYKKLLRSKDKTIKENRLYLRELKCSILKEYIEKNKIEYFQPESKKSGTVFAFRNNCVHAGGFTNFGHERIVSLMHIYPTPIKTSLEEKFKDMHLKIAAYPK